MDAGLHWLLADARETVRLRPAVADGRSSPRAAARERSRPRESPGSDAAVVRSGVRTEVARWGARIQRLRLVAILRRQLILAAALAVVLEALTMLGLPQPAVVAAALALLAGGTILALRRRPSPLAVAQLLDERIGLFDTLGTALELEGRPSGPRGALAARAMSDAQAALAAGRRGWRAASAPASREWGLLAGMLALLAAVSLIATQTGAGAGEHGAGAQSQSATLAGGTGAQAQGRRPGTHPAQGTQQHRTSHSQSPAGTAPSTAGRFHGARHSGYRVPGHTGRAGEPSGASHSGARTRSGGERTASVGSSKQSTGNNAPAGSKGAGEGATKGFKEMGGAATKGAISPVNLPPKQISASKLAGSNGAGRHGSSNAAGSPGTKKTGARSGASGSPTSSARAGHEQGAGRTGQAHRTGGQTSGRLSLKAGYAPVHSASPGHTGGKHGNSQGGGGKSGSALVTGGSAAGGEAGGQGLPYVPPEGGAVPEESSSLIEGFQEATGGRGNYKWLQEPW